MGGPKKIAHCVGDVDKRTFSENLDVGVECRLGIEDPQGCGSLGLVAVGGRKVRQADPTPSNRHNGRNE
jgi:hypothetical protein